LLKISFTRKEPSLAAMDLYILKYNLMEISSPDNNLEKAFFNSPLLFTTPLAFLFPVITILFSLDEINETVNLSYNSTKFS
jgi:hypothetical protein